MVPRWPGPLWESPPMFGKITEVRFFWENQFFVFFGAQKNLKKKKFNSWPWSLNLMKNWLGYIRLKIRLDFWRVNKKLKSSQYLEWYLLSLTSISQPKLHQIKHAGGVLESSFQSDSITFIGSPIWLRIHGENSCKLNCADCKCDLHSFCVKVYKNVKKWNKYQRTNLLLYIQK